jgi:hypothetical protein
MNKIFNPAYFETDASEIGLKVSINNEKIILTSNQPERGNITLDSNRIQEYINLFGDIKSCLNINYNL